MCTVRPIHACNTCSAQHSVASYSPKIADGMRTCFCKHDGCSGIRACVGRRAPQEEHAVRLAARAGVAANVAQRQRQHAQRARRQAGYQAGRKHGHVRPGRHTCAAAASFVRRLASQAVCTLPLYPAPAPVLCPVSCVHVSALAADSVVFNACIWAPRSAGKLLLHKRMPRRMVQSRYALDSRLLAAQQVQWQPPRRQAGAAKRRSACARLASLLGRGAPTSCCCTNASACTPAAYRASPSASPRLPSCRTSRAASHWGGPGSCCACRARARLLGGSASTASGVKSAAHGATRPAEQSQASAIAGRQMQFFGGLRTALNRS